MLKILFYDTKVYERDLFEERKKEFPGIEIDYLKSELAPDTARYAKGYDAVCAFVNCDVGTETVSILHESGVKLILLRCAGFNHVDIEKAKECGIKVLRVPGYSPEAVAEHAMALALAANRRIHKAYVRVRENDFSLGGMLGFTFIRRRPELWELGRLGRRWRRSVTDSGWKLLPMTIIRIRS